MVDEPVPPKTGVAIITGVSRGLGRAIAMALARAGYVVATCSRTYQKDAVEALKEASIAEKGPFWDMVDVRSYEEVKKYVASVHDAAGPIDVLVNNAGVVHPRKPVQEIRHEDFDPAFETHFCGPLAFIEGVLPGMLERKSGVIVNVASKAARYAVPGFAAYNASKAALISLTQTLAKEVDGTGVRVYSVSPGGMSTTMREEAYGKEDTGKQQSPEYVASVITGIVTKGRIRARYHKANGYDAVLPPLPGHLESQWEAEWEVPNGADVLVWKEGVEIFKMPERK